jgi:dCMP deaminase
MEWSTYWTEMAHLVATRSKDRSTKVGCVIVGPGNEVVSTGYNGFPRGCDDNRQDWHERPKKYAVTVHAEMNAICNTARVGSSLIGCTAYVTLFPCSDCTKHLIQAGVTEIVVVGTKPDNTERFEESWAISREISQETGVPIRTIGEGW